jgi:virulence factor
MLDDTIHQIDTLRFFCGEARAISTQSVRRKGKISAAVFTVAMERGGLAQVQTSLEGGAWEEQYDLFGGSQSVHVDAFERVSLTNREGKSEWKEGYASTYISTLEGRGFTGEIQHFFDCVEKRQEPQTSAWDSVKTQLLLEGMLEKAEEL